MVLVVIRNGGTPAPHDSPRVKTKDWPFKFTIGQTFDPSRDVRVELRSSGRIALVEIGDRFDDVSDRRRDR
jgi:hypothetical protein